MTQLIVTALIGVVLMMVSAFFVFEEAYDHGYERGFALGWTEGKRRRWREEVEVEGNEVLG